MLRKLQSIVDVAEAPAASHLQSRIKTRSDLGARTPARMPESQYFSGFRSGPHSVIEVITNEAEIYTADPRPPGISRSRSNVRLLRDQS